MRQNGPEPEKNKNKNKNTDSDTHHKAMSEGLIRICGLWAIFI
jgi:hypothetical protein